MTTPQPHPLWLLSRGFASFRTQHQRELLAMWGIVLTLVGGFLGVQPNWQSDVVVALLLVLSLAATGLRFALTAPGMTVLTEACGESILGEALAYVLELTRRWRMAGHLQPAWQ